MRGGSLRHHVTPARLFVAAGIVLVLGVQLGIQIAPQRSVDDGKAKVASTSVLEPPRLRSGASRGTREGVSGGFSHIDGTGGWNSGGRRQGAHEEAPLPGSAAGGWGVRESAAGAVADRNDARFKHDAGVVGVETTVKPSEMPSEERAGQDPELEFPPAEAAACEPCPAIPTALAPAPEPDAQSHPPCEPASPEPCVCDAVTGDGADSLRPAVVPPPDVRSAASGQLPGLARNASLVVVVPTVARKMRIQERTLLKTGRVQLAGRIWTQFKAADVTGHDVSQMPSWSRGIESVAGECIRHATLDDPCNAFNSAGWLKMLPDGSVSNTTLDSTELTTLYVLESPIEHHELLQDGNRTVWKNSTVPVPNIVDEHGGAVGEWRFGDWGEAREPTKEERAKHLRNELDTDLYRTTTPRYLLDTLKGMLDDMGGCFAPEVPLRVGEKPSVLSQAATAAEPRQSGTARHPTPATTTRRPESTLTAAEQRANAAAGIGPPQDVAPARATHPRGYPAGAGDAGRWTTARDRAAAEAGAVSARVEAAAAAAARPASPPPEWAGNVPDEQGSPPAGNRQDADAGPVRSSPEVTVHGRAPGGGRRLLQTLAGDKQHYGRGNPFADGQTGTPLAANPFGGTAETPPIIGDANVWDTGDQPAALRVAEPEDVRADGADLHPSGTEPPIAEHPFADTRQPAIETSPGTFTPDSVHPAADVWQRTEHEQGTDLSATEAQRADQVPLHATAIPQGDAELGTNVLAILEAQRQAPEHLEHNPSPRPDDHPRTELATTTSLPDVGTGTVGTSNPSFADEANRPREIIAPTAEEVQVSEQLMRAEGADEPAADEPSRPPAPAAPAESDAASPRDEPPKTVEPRRTRAAPFAGNIHIAVFNNWKAKERNVALREAQIEAQLRAAMPNAGHATDVPDHLTASAAAAIAEEELRESSEFLEVMEALSAPEYSCVHFYDDVPEEFQYFREESFAPGPHDALRIDPQRMAGQEAIIGNVDAVLGSTDAADVLLWEDDCAVCPGAFRLLSDTVSFLTDEGKNAEAVLGHALYDGASPSATEHMYKKKNSFDWAQIRVGNGGSGLLMRHRHAREGLEFMKLRASVGHFDVNSWVYAKEFRRPHIISRKVYSAHQGVHSSFDDASKATEIKCGATLEYYWGKYSTCVTPVLDKHYKCAGGLDRSWRPR